MPLTVNDERRVAALVNDMLVPFEDQVAKAIVVAIKEDRERPEARDQLTVSPATVTSVDTATGNITVTFDTDPVSTPVPVGVFGAAAVGQRGQVFHTPGGGSYFTVMTGTGGGGGPVDPPPPVGTPLFGSIDNPVKAATSLTMPMGPAVWSLRRNDAQEAVTLALTPGEIVGQVTFDVFTDPTYQQLANIGGYVETFMTGTGTGTLDIDDPVLIDTNAFTVDGQVPGSVPSSTGGGLIFSVQHPGAAEPVEAARLTARGEWWQTVEGVDRANGSFTSYWFDGAHAYPNAWASGSTGLQTIVGVNEFDATPMTTFQSYATFRNKAGQSASTVGTSHMRFAPQIVADGQTITAAVTPIFGSALNVPPGSPTQQEDVTTRWVSWDGIVDNAYYTAINGGHLDYTGNDGKSVGYQTLPVFVGHVDFGSRIDFWASEVAFHPQRTGNDTTLWRQVAVDMAQGSPNLGGNAPHPQFQLSDLGMTVTGDGIPEGTTITQVNTGFDAVALSHPVMQTASGVTITLARKPTMGRHVAFRVDAFRAATANRSAQLSAPIEAFPDTYTHWSSPTDTLGAFIGSTGNRLYLDYPNATFGYWSLWGATVAYKQDGDPASITAAYGHRAIYKNARRTITGCEITTGSTVLTSQNGARDVSGPGSAEFGPGDVGAIITVFADVTLTTTIASVQSLSQITLADTWPGVDTTSASATITNDATIGNIFDADFAPTFQADRINMTTPALMIGIHSVPAFQAVNSGTLTVSDYANIEADVLVTSGVTMQNRYGLKVGDAVNGDPSRIANQFGVHIEHMTGALKNYGLSNASTSIFPPTVQVVTNSTTINVDATVIYLQATGSVVLPNPNLTVDGLPAGQVVTIVNLGPGTVTFTTGQGVQNGFTLAQYGSVELVSFSIGLGGSFWIPRSGAAGGFDSSGQIISEARIGEPKSLQHALIGFNHALAFAVVGQPVNSTPAAEVIELVFGDSLTGGFVANNNQSAWPAIYEAEMCRRFNSWERTKGTLAAITSHNAPLYPDHWDWDTYSGPALSASHQPASAVWSGAILTPGNNLAFSGDGDGVDVYFTARHPGGGTALIQLVGPGGETDITPIVTDTGTLAQDRSKIRVSIPAPGGVRGHLTCTVWHNGGGDVWIDFAYLTNGNRTAGYKQHSLGVGGTRLLDWTSDTAAFPGLATAFKRYLTNNHPQFLTFCLGTNDYGSEGGWPDNPDPGDIRAPGPPPPTPTEMAARLTALLATIRSCYVGVPSPSIRFIFEPQTEFTRNATNWGTDYRAAMRTACEQDGNVAFVDWYEQVGHWTTVEDEYSQAVTDPNTSNPVIHTHPSEPTHYVWGLGLAEHTLAATPTAAQIGQRLTDIHSPALAAGGKFRIAQTDAFNSVGLQVWADASTGSVANFGTVFGTPAWGFGNGTTIDVSCIRSGANTALLTGQWRVVDGTAGHGAIQLAQAGALGSTLAIYKNTADAVAALTMLPTGILWTAGGGLGTPTDLSLVRESSGHMLCTGTLFRFNDGNAAHGGVRIVTTGGGLTGIASFANSNDTQPTVYMSNGNGIQWGAGASASPEITMNRVAANTLRLTGIYDVIDGTDAHGRVRVTASSVGAIVGLYSNNLDNISQATLSTTGLSFGPPNAAFDVAITRTGLFSLGVVGQVTGNGAILSTNPSGGVGYATGAGGTQAQGSGSGKSTAVTLNKICGRITMNNAALASGTSVGFSFTNSAIAATDGVVVWIVSGATLNAYIAFVDAVTAGSCHVQLRNVSAGSLSEGVVLGFAVIKAVTA